MMANNFSKRGKFNHGWARMDTDLERRFGFWPVSSWRSRLILQAAFFILLLNNAPILDHCPAARRRHAGSLLAGAAV
jgi:hypothetical protein